MNADFWTIKSIELAKEASWEFFDICVRRLFWWLKQHHVQTYAGQNEASCVVFDILQKDNLQKTPYIYMIIVSSSEQPNKCRCIVLSAFFFLKKSPGDVSTSQSASAFSTVLKWPHDCFFYAVFSTKDRNSDGGSRYLPSVLLWLLWTT